jgi:hypothetical protein
MTWADTLFFFAGVAVTIVVSVVLIKGMSGKK